MDNQELTKKEQYLLRKEQKEKERLKQIRRKKLKKVMMILLPSIFIIGGVVYGILYFSPEKSGGTPKIEISPQEYDAGTVSMAEGLVEHTYEIKNNGDGDLKIDRIWTSCMCTTAQLKVGERESPEFSMHSSPIFWSQKIAPKENGFLKVTFDPAYHGPQGTGPVIRAVYLSSNDPQNKKVEARLIVNVVQ